MPPKAQAGLSKTAKKNKKKKAKAAAAKQQASQQQQQHATHEASAGGHQQYSDDDDGLEDDDDDVVGEQGMPRMPLLDAFPQSPMNLSQPLNASMLAGFAPGSAFGSNTPFPAATQQELLATANELYRQIETAAAAALASTAPNSGRPTPASNNRSMPPPPMPMPGDETDDAYWSSLPAHLRSFIKNALPLAAGLAPGSAGDPYANAAASSGTHASGVAAAHALNLSPEQMHQAAQQLAQVVQSTGWASLGVPPGTAPFGPGNVRSTQSGNTTTTTTTIPLGSFTLPLHPHPDHPHHQQHPDDSYGELEVDLTDGYSDDDDDEDLEDDDEDIDDEDDLPQLEPVRDLPMPMPQQGQTFSASRPVSNVSISRL